MRHILVRPDDHDAACRPVYPAHIVNVAAVLEVRAEGFLVIRQSEPSLAGAQDIGQGGDFRFAESLLEHRAKVDCGVDIGRLWRMFSNG